MNITKISNISIIIPAYNEQNRILTFLNLLDQYSKRWLENFEVIIINDGSIDLTHQVVSDFIQFKENFILVDLSQNIGKGGAIEKGVEIAKKQTICFMDADGSTDLEMIQKLYGHLSERVDVVIGSRGLLDSAISVRQNFFRSFFGKVFNHWVQFWILPGIHDTQCGFKMFKANVAKEIFSELHDKRFGFDMEILFKAKLSNYQIKEVPVKWSNVEGTSVKIFRDGLKMALYVPKLRFLQRRLLSRIVLKKY